MWTRLLRGGVLAAVLVSSSSAWAGGSGLPPDVDLDPDRGMTFGRLGRTRLQGEVFEPTKDSLRSRVMDPSIDPFNSMLQSDRYEPSTGKIQGGLSDTLRDMRKRQETSRRDSKNSDDSD
jgi:hypothetical protein